MLGFGLDDKIRFHEPEIYLKTPIIKKLENTVVFDPNYITNVGISTSGLIEKYFDDNKIHIDAQMALRNNSLPINKSSQTISAKSLIEFCSIIVSCKELYCLTTGTATLAAALKKNSTVLYGEGINPFYHHSRIHKYIKL